jgi:hypothetical protein
MQSLVAASEKARQVQPSLHTPRSGAAWDATLAKAGKISNLQTPQ